MLDPDSTDEMKTVEAFVERLALRAIAMGGTCTGEHGIGYGKIPSCRRSMARASP